jgi:hypothetical protein
MKLFLSGLISVIFIGLCVSVSLAEESSLGNVPPTMMIANQELSPAATSLESSMPIIADSVEGSLESYETAVPFNEERDRDHRVVIETIAPPRENVVTFVERSPFNRMKQLAGRWEGLGENALGEKSNKIVVVYEVTAGGNAVMERIFPGTSQEMITMYYEQKGQLALTHYCLIGTRSTMMLKPLAVSENSRPSNTYEFSLIENAGLDPTVDTHMNSLKVAFIDEDHMNQSWEMFEAGKPSGSYSFALTRVDNKP